MKLRKLQISRSLSMNTTEHDRIARAAGVVGSATLLSRILGYARDMVVAYFFGAGLATDAFFVAFRIPNTLRRLFGEGSMTVSFLPVYTEYLLHRTEEESQELVDVAFTLASSVLMALTILGIVFAPQITVLLAPGFEDPKKVELTIFMLRIVFPYLFFIGLFALAMGVLNAHRHFAAPALAPSLLNVSMIASAYLLFHRLAEPVVSLSIGVLFGGVIQLAFQFPFLIKKGVMFRFNFRFFHPAIKRICILMGPAVLGQGVAQINVLVGNIIASFLLEGSISYLYYAYRLIEFPLGVFVIALGTAALPSFSQLVSEGKMEEFRDTISFSLRLVLFVAVPAMVGLIVLRVPIIHLLFQHGAFGYDDTLMAARALFYFAIGLWAIAGVRILAPAFYAVQDTKTPVKMAVVSLFANVGLSLILMGPMKHAGLAVANSLASILYVSLLLVWLRKKIGEIDRARIMRSLLQIAAASAATGWVAYWVVGRTSWMNPGYWGEKILILGAAIVAGMFTYIVISYLLRNDELSFLIGLLWGKRKELRREGEIE
jgi:putative peptidoglycan lipid II flippase